MKKPLAFSKVSGSVTAARGFRAAGLAAGIKKSGKKDMALIVSDEPATVAGVFTRNQVKAAPVKLDMLHVQSGQARLQVLRTPDRWFGVTYKDDRPQVVAGIRELVARGEYPEQLGV